MALPTSRDEFQNFCLEQLGSGVIQINVSQSQIDNATDIALKYYADYHYNGNEKVYYKYQLTQKDFDNGYITMPDNIIGAVRIFDIPGTFNTTSMFDIRYQIALNDLYSLTSVSLVPYYVTFQQLQFMEQILVGKVPIRYNRLNQRLHLDMDWSKLNVGSYVVVEAYAVIDPESYSTIWSEKWLIEYTTALIKKVWGNNLKKFSGMAMSGGVTFNGQIIYDEAVEEIKEMENRMILDYSMPCSDLIG